MKNRKMSHPLAAAAAFALVTLFTFTAISPPLAADEPATIEITVTDRGYEPSRIELAEGEPVRLVFHQQAKSECAHSVKSPEVGLEKTALPPGETTVVTITPEETGTFTFACGMDMLKGTILVEAR